MLIHFNNLHIISFKSIGEASVELSQRGLVTVRGVNNYEDNADSNGSGKSSIFSALFWVLYGKTPEGIANPTNRYYTKNCQVVVSIDIDNVNYEICRQVSKSSQSVSIKQNGDEISCRNRTDSDKYIRDSILRMSGELFLSLIYLNQGFSSRLSLLPPAARKERLESLVNTVELVDDFSGRLQELSNRTMSKIRKDESDYNQLIGSKESYLRIISQRQSNIDDAISAKTMFEYGGKEYSQSSLPDLQIRLQSELEHLNELSNKLGNLRRQQTEYNQNYRQVTSRITQINNDKSQISSQMHSAHTGVCPTCNQSINTEISNKLIFEAEQRLEHLNNELIDCNSKQEEYSKFISSIDEEISIQSKIQSDCRQVYDELTYIIKNIPKVNTVDIESLKADIQEYSQQCDALDIKLSELQSIISTTQHELDVLAHCRQLVTKSFRNYLLQNAILFLNSRLKYYSSALFSNSSDCVKVSADSQKLEITLGEASYDSLSGGEQRRVDIPLMLAQKDLAAEVAGITSNLLILDEILESMDEKATQITLQLLEKQSRNVESMFIISHNQYSLPADSTIVIEKGADRVASISNI